MVVLQPQSSHHNMPKKGGKKKAKVHEEDLDLEIFPMIEIIYEDTKEITGVEPEFKWGQIYHMIKDHTVPDVGLEDISLYENIRRSGITKVSTRPDIFPCAEVIGWILPQADARTMIMSNIEGKYFSSFTPTYIAKICNLPTP